MTTIRTPTEGLRRVWRRAAQEAAEWGSPTIEPVHFLQAILALADPHSSGEEDRLLYRAASNGQVDPVALRASLRRVMPRGAKAYAAGEQLHRSDASRRAFSRAGKIADPNAVSAPHLLAAILEEPDRTVAKAFRYMGVRPSRLLKQVVFPKPDHPHKEASEPPIPTPPGSPPASPPSAGDQSVLATFGRDLTQAAREGRIPPIVGRRKEVLQTIQALARKKKNNPVLVGEAGVGKTAIVEALAQRVVDGKDPGVLSGLRIVELDMGSLLSGTSLRGQFEERMTQLIEEASADENLVLFIDEIHTLIGAGGGNQDAAQLLKPALSRGRLKLIGATTLDEYRVHIEKDPAMDRRFERILVEEPTRDEAVEMLTGLSNSLSAHYGVSFPQAAVEAAVDLSMRVDVNNRLPDKAIDLLDRAGARARVGELSLAPAGFSQDQEVSITPRDVALALADKMAMPVEIVAGHLESKSARRILELEAFLGHAIKGQDAAIEEVSRRMILAHAPVVTRRGPLATMLFLGPSGVGKTEVARQLALFLFGSERNLIRLDMSEFKEEHSVAKLIGAPPGYVGSDREGQLTGAIRKKPYSVVLLDEVEKANQRIYDVFLQVFDEGRITDAKGRLIDARNCIFVLTTNVRPPGGISDSASVKEALKTWFRPELLNRIDDIVTFAHLSPAAIDAILESILAHLIAEVESSYRIRLAVSASARELLAREGYDPEYGARELGRTLEKHVHMPLSKHALSGDLQSHPDWLLDARGGVIVLERM